MSDSLEPANPGGRPRALDDEKRRTIVAMLANGSSRRMAAGYVGCDPATITREMIRDPDFAAAVARAEQNTEIDALRHVRKAAQKDRYWRAAAWLLERRNPQDFAKRPPFLYTDEQVATLWLKALDPILAKLSDEDFWAVMHRIEDLAGLARSDPKTAFELPEPHPAPPPTEAELSQREEQLRLDRLLDAQLDDPPATPNGCIDLSTGGSFASDTTNEPCDETKTPSSETPSS